MKSAAWIISGSMLNPLARDRVQFLRQGSLVFDDSGTILAVGPRGRLERRFPRAHRIAVTEGDVIVPGLVDCHTHFAQYDSAGRNDENLLEWLSESIYPEEARFRDPGYARPIARKFFQDLVRAGTTTASVFSTIHETATDIAFHEARRAGIRAIIGKTMMDRNAPDDLLERTDASIEASIRLCRKWNGRDEGRLRYAFSPRFAPSCSFRLMKQAARAAAKLNAHVQTHLAETQEEVAWVRKLFPNADSYTKLYEQAQLVRPKAVFGHGIYLSRSDHAVLRRAGAGIAHCPASNLFLRSGLMDFRRATADGVSVGLGSDIGAGPVPSILRAMGSAGYISKVLDIESGSSRRGRSGLPLDPKELFFAATLGGASALGVDREIGNLEVGKRADFIVLNSERLYTIPPKTAELDASSIMTLMAYRGDDSVIRETYVDGRLVYAAA